MTFDVTLVPLDGLPEPAGLLAEIAALELGPGQEAFVGVPAAMAELAMADPQRHLFAITVPGRRPEVVGMGVLHVGGVTASRWNEYATAILLRGFLIDRSAQGSGCGAAAAAAAVGLAQELAAEHNLPAQGVALCVDERNPAGIHAYEKAGFEDRGQYLGGRSGPQRFMYRPFGST